jgi:hypothetical protein
VGKRREVARDVDAVERAGEDVAPLLEARLGAPLVEGAEDLGGGGLRRTFLQGEEDDVVVRELERGQLRAVTGAELGPVAEEEGHVGADRRGDAMQLVRGQRPRELRVRERERRRSVGAATAEPSGNRDALLEPHVPPGGSPGGGGERCKGHVHERVVGEAVHDEIIRGLDLDDVVELDVLEHRGDLVLPVSAA